MYLMMTTKVTQRDTQCAKFYAWMHRFENTMVQESIQSHLIEITILEFAKQLRIPAPQFCFKFKFKSKWTTGATATGESLVYLKLNYDIEYVNMSTIMGSLVYKHHQNQLQEGWHGPTFCRVWANIFAQLSNINVEDIVTSMRAAGLKVINSYDTSPTVRGIVKKLEQSKNRVIELETAIQRGRQEFEEFLQPILNELATSKAEVVRLEQKIQR